MEDNKRELTSFLSIQLSMVIPKDGCELIVSGGFSDPKHITTSNKNHNVSSLSSTHEEADTRIVLHTHEASACGYDRVIVVARDTDVLILLVAFQHAFHDSEVWLKSGTARKPKFVAVHNIKLAADIQENLLAFHALTGSDTTSQFSGIGKITAWKAFCTGSNAKLLRKLGEEHLSSPEVRSSVEAFVVKLYKPSSTESSIQVLRSAMFRTSKKQLESLPPTKDALQLHIRRAHFQTFVWRNSLVAQPNLPSPLLSGWKTEDDRLVPILMGQDGVPANYLQLTTCGCTEAGQQCRRRQCMCNKAGLKCTSACACAHYLGAVDDWCKNPHNHTEEGDPDENNNNG